MCTGCDIRECGLEFNLYVFRQFIMIFLLTQINLQYEFTQITWEMGTINPNWLIPIDLLPNTTKKSQYSIIFY